jgi:hypothetical protein
MLASSVALSLDIPLGTKTSNAIILSPPVQVSSRAAAVEYHAAAMASYGGAISRFVGNTGSNCDSMATTSMKSCLIDVGMYITNI